MNPEKLKQLQAQGPKNRTGGKGTARRKKKVVHKTASTDDKKIAKQFEEIIRYKYSWNRRGQYD